MDIHIENYNLSGPIINTRQLLIYNTYYIIHELFFFLLVFLINVL